ncbi:hypothetical protein COD79_18715 [Bacillus cereus]|uniref:matrixin family metalloprotease n=1 Tax=Bacillus cereus TaxID=1396 RepID=UPI000BF2A6BD|nr:matrixin family metalloprotease [Bacillus cereus]PEU03389.1 hypothetical protein CN531_28845 [Bacillus cereus]PFB15185.1 hypothetical protein CN412_26375 [Bacillus cereus]PGV34335.1 hypothetical protein COD79_18715 [Bacillus cereus]
MSEVIRPRSISEALDKARQALELSQNAVGNGQYAEAVIQAQAAVDILRGFEPSPDKKKEYLELFAYALYILAVRLIQANRKKEAVAPSVEAVQLYRQLAVMNGVDIMAIARYLTDLSLHLCNVAGLCPDSVYPQQAAVDILREFEPPSDKKKEYLELFAYSLYILSIRFILAGRGSEATGPAREAVQQYRQLAAMSGADVMVIARYLADLSLHLCNVAGLCLDAINPQQVAVDILRGFEPPSDKKKEYLELLAYSYYILAVRLILAGRGSEATGPAKNAVQQYRQLTIISGVDVMEIAQYLADLSLHLCNVAQLCADAVNPQQAAVDILRGFQPPPDKKKDYLKLFAYSLYILAIRFIQANKGSEAVGPTEEVVHLYRELAPESGDDLTTITSYLLDLSSWLCHAAGLCSESVSPAQAAVDLLRRVQPAYEQLFADALYTLAFFSQISGRVIEAILPAKEAVKVYRELAVMDPNKFSSLLQKAEQLVFAMESRSFCDVPDRGGSIFPLTYGSSRGRWNRTTLSVSINTTNCNFSIQGSALTPNDLVTNAFRLWQNSSIFTFNFVPFTEVADIRVVFDKLDGRKGGKVGRGGYPGTNKQGELVLDKAETWSDGSVPGTVNLLPIAIHEIGHVLGLSHSNLPGGTMYPLNLPTTVTTVDAESQEALRVLYGWRPQQKLSDRGTTDRPSLGITSSFNFTTRIDIPRMVWKGIRGDHQFYESELLSGGWSPQQIIPNRGSTHSPALATISTPDVTRTGLIMAWKGVSDDSNLYWSRDLGNGWEPQRIIPGVGSLVRPALANVSGRIYMAWRGIDDDEGIYWSQFDGVGAWSPQQRIRGIGTSDSPALVGVGNRMYMFWKGTDGDSKAYWSVIDFSNDPIWRPQRIIEYFSYEADGGVAHAIGTTGGLTATQRGDSILIAWKGVEDDPGIYVSLFANNEFGGQIKVPNIGTSSGPMVVQTNGITLMAWKGDGVRNIYWTTL